MYIGQQCKVIIHQRVQTLFHNAIYVGTRIRSLGVEINQAFLQPPLRTFIFCLAVNTSICMSACTYYVCTAATQTRARRPGPDWKVAGILFSTNQSLWTSHLN